MPNTDRPPACPDCDWTGMRSVLVITDKTRTVYAAPCGCDRGRAMSHPPNLPTSGPGSGMNPPPLFWEFADMHRRKGAEVHVTDRFTTRFPLSLTNPKAWADAQAFRGDKPNPYTALLERIQGRMREVEGDDP